MMGRPSVLTPRACSRQALADPVWKAQAHLIIRPRLTTAAQCSIRSRLLASGAQAVPEAPAAARTPQVVEKKETDCQDLTHQRHRGLMPQRHQVLMPQKPPDRLLPK